MERVLAVLGASPAAPMISCAAAASRQAPCARTLLELELEGRITRMGGDLVQLLR